MRKNTMKTYEFTIIASGLDPDAPGFADRFFEVNCDDALLFVVKGKIVLAFHREARNFSQALASAIQDVTRAGVIVEHVAPENPVPGGAGSGKDRP